MLPVALLTLTVVVSPIAVVVPPVAVLPLAVVPPVAVLPLAILLPITIVECSKKYLFRKKYSNMYCNLYTYVGT